MDKEATRLAADVRAKRHMAMIFSSDPEAAREFKAALEAFRLYVEKKTRYAPKTHK